MLSEKEFKDKYNYSAATPIMQQYLDIKMKNQDCLVLFRLGDFYELFFEDAQIASSMLNLVLTARDKNSLRPIAMCGMPFHSVKPYVTRLINEGYKVAICEQVESPLEAKKRGGYKAIVKREISNILTPGTVIDDDVIEINRPSYLVSLVFHFTKNECCICFIDLGARDLGLFSINIDQCKNELEILNPKEILISVSQFEQKQVMEIMKDFHTKVVVQADVCFSVQKTTKLIEDFYKISTVKSISENITDTQIQSIGAILDYISITQKSNFILPLPKIIHTCDFMMIDAATQNNLEVIKSSNEGGDSLFKILNYTRSSGGSRLLHKCLLKPLTNIDLINSRLHVTKFFVKNVLLKKQIQEEIKCIGDPERSFAKISMRRANVVDFINIKNSLIVGDRIKGILFEQNNDFPVVLKNILDNIPNDLVIKDEITKAINESSLIINQSDGGFINVSYHPKLKILQDDINKLKQQEEFLCKEYRKLTGIENLKIQSNNILGTFIEVPIGKSSKMNHDAFIHKQTNVNNARFSSLELQSLTKDLLSLKTQSVALECEILEELTQEIVYHSQSIHKLSSSLAQIDFFCSLSEAALTNNYVMPVINKDKTTKIEDGRHPVIEKSLERKAQKFVPNNCNFSKETDLIILTGPNMGGKSTFLRQNALIILMAHVGSFVPASSAEIGLVDRIFTRIGAQDNLTKGLSTFMLEMVETSAILSQATSKSFIILDEVGRGTSTYDGMSIASACAEYIANEIKSRCIFATHYHEITSLTSHITNASNYNMQIIEKGESIYLSYKVQPGIVNKSYGVNVAKIAGLPKKVLDRANAILLSLEK